MTSAQLHVDTSRLSAWLETELSPDEQRRVEHHLASCAECGDRLARLQTLLREARSLPDAIDPPDELWSAVRARVESAEPRARSRLHLRRWELAAAAAVLVALTSVLTTLVVRRPTVVVVQPAATPVAAVATPFVGPGRSIDADYSATIRQLDDALAEHRAELAPATIAKVEASLRVIDGAITEARRALAADPANLTLLDILSANYQRKLELLRRATELPPTT
jgi:hypothetical protein